MCGIKCAAKRVLTSCVQYLPRSAFRKVYFPEVCPGFSELDSYCPFATIQGAHVRDSAFSLFASALIYKQNPLALLDLGGQRERSAMSVYRQHARELAEGFPEHGLPKNVHANG